MKISELIIALNDAYKQYGDLEVTDAYQDFMTCIALDSTNETPTIIISDSEDALPNDLNVKVLEIIP